MSANRGAGTDGDLQRMSRCRHVPPAATPVENDVGFDLVWTRTTIQQTSGAAGIVVGSGWT
jgi:hypothetical protein